MFWASSRGDRIVILQVAANTTTIKIRFLFLFSFFFTVHKKLIFKSAIKIFLTAFFLHRRRKIRRVEIDDRM